MAQLTVGVPLYNNERTLLRALGSLAAQTYADIRVVLSDDVSQDRTPEIAEEFAARDPRFELHRQPLNLNYGNFRYVLKRADSPYFMFAAGDDWWDRRYAEQCIGALEANPDAVCAVSQVQFDGTPSVNSFKAGTAPLIGGAVDNFCAFLAAPMANTRMYGVFRTAVARAAFPETNHHAFDWTFSAGTLLEGWHLEVPEVLMYREKTPSAQYVEYVRRDARRRIDRVLPLWAMTETLLRNPRLPRNAKVYRTLAKANLLAHDTYMARYHPRVRRLTSPLLNRLAWNL